MTLHQSAYNRPSSEQTITAYNQVALHEDPTPFEQDTFESYAANPEEILMAKEAALSDYRWASPVDSYWEEEVNDEADYLFSEIAPTTTNIKESRLNNSWYFKKTTIERV